MSSSLIDMLPEVMGAAAAVTTLAALLTRFFPIIEEQRARRERRRAHVKEVIQKKLDAKIELSVRDVLNVGHGAGSSSGDTTESLYELYADASDPGRHAQIKKLIEDLNRDEPFEGLPVEARPSMARLAALCESSSAASDHELLHPIRKLLEEYVAMKQDHQTIKRQNRISYAIAIVSFFIGVVGLILAFTGPSKEFISSEIRRALKEERPNQAP